MDWWAKKNLKVDCNAKLFLKKCKRAKREHFPVHLLYKKWAVYVNGTKQSTIDKKSLYATLSAPQTLKYWEEHHGIKVNPKHNTGWQASQQV